MGTNNEMPPAFLRIHLHFIAQLSPLLSPRRNVPTVEFPSAFEWEREGEREVGQRWATGSVGGGKQEGGSEGDTAF